MGTKWQYVDPDLWPLPTQAVISWAAVNQAGFPPRMRTLRANVSSIIQVFLQEVLFRRAFWKAV